MKKALIALTLMLSAGPAFTASGHTAEAVVTHASGAPMIVRNGQEIPAAVGTTCQTSDILKTADGCVVDVSMNGKVGCRVLAQSEVLLASADTSDMSLKVNGGNVILNVEKLAGSTFKVETPTAVATVRGTQFWGRVLDPTDLNPTTTFAVREGAVEIFAKSVNQTYTVKAGEALDIPKTADAAPAIRPALAEELAAMEQASAVKTSA